jgi:flavin-dependent thymidylate synthase
VFLLNATPDPLGTLAADMRMYRGDPVYSLDEITEEQRVWAWNELSKTKLNTPLEGVQLKFMIEAVTRSFTHQMVRQRVGAYYVQESLRFAVKRGLASEVALPPSLWAEPEEGPGKIWSDTVEAISAAYNALVDAGIPAEDARGLLPHATTTRIIYTTNLRALFELAGNRLCTQAQFEWRAVFIGIIRAIREYRGARYSIQIGEKPGLATSKIDRWQWQMIAEPKAYTFTPICYRLGHCAFMSHLDRGCTIRERVNNGQFDDIEPMEWIASPMAGITTEDNPRPPE